MTKFLNIGTDFWKQTLTLFSGSLLAQVISIVFLPILSRLYLPEAFGIFGVFVAAVAVMVVMINGGYELCIMLPASEEEANTLLKLSLWVSHGLSLCLMLLAILLGPALLEIAALTQLRGWHLLIPLSIWQEGVFQALGFWLNRKQAYKILSTAKVIRSAVTVGVSFVLALYGWGFEGLLLGFLGGQVASTSYSFYYYHKAKEASSSAIDTKLLWKTAKNYADFPRYSVISSWLNVASKHLPFFLLPRFYSPVENGLFSKADRILNLPAVLISMSIGRVFFEKASRAHEQDSQSLAQLTQATFIRLLLLALPFFAIVMLWAPDLFAFVLGDPWYEAGRYAQALMPWMFMVFIASPLSYLIDIFRKLKLFLYFNLALFLVRLTALFVGYSYGDALTAIWFFGLSGAAMVLLQLLYVLWLGRKK